MTAVIEQSRALSPRNTATSSAPVRTQPKGRVVGTFQCLVVSTDSDRLAILEHAAFEGGWSTVVCGDVEQARLAVKRQRFQLAVIDLDGAESPEELKALSKDISEFSKTLLVVCGNEGDGLEEIWARQLGAWLYLPGVTAGSDVTALCEQAMPVAEKLNGTTNQQVAS